jgi:hypothetical protein
MHKPRKEVSSERMNEILARHAKPNVEVKTEAPKPPESGTLQWDEPQKARDGVYIMRSQCKRYAIHAERVEKKWRYECLRRTDVWNNVLGFVWSKEAAIGLCEKHSQAHPGTATTSTADPRE